MIDCILLTSFPSFLFLFFFFFLVLMMNIDEYDQVNGFRLGSFRAVCYDLRWISNVMYIPFRYSDVC
jgi:hypothetical protein